MKYEYKIVSVDTVGGLWRQGDVDEEELLKIIDDLAEKDWEFVSATPLSTLAFFRQSGLTSKILLFFKRPEK
jgi:hypothetical protein